MDEVENKESEVVELATPETENPAESESKPQSAPEQSSTEDNDQERDWRELRRRKKELADTVKMQQELIDELRSLRNPPKAPEVDEIDTIGDEEYIPKGKVNKLVEKKARAYAKAEVEAMLKQQEQSQFLERLQRQYSDFNEIVTPETLALLEEKEPELAKMMSEQNDPYKIGVQSYKYIKALGLASDVPTSRRVKEVEKRLDKNNKTVQSPQAFDKRPMAEAFRLTDTEKTKLYEEMTKYASQAGFSY